ncbi:MAG: N-acetylmuramoyl-L-alanine amidase [Rhodospirillales bacterium]|nr:N-acetylmuramoyl-L-alanine amidase [Rhodospirillales bacterium]
MTRRRLIGLAGLIVLAGTVPGIATPAPGISPKLASCPGGPPAVAVDIGHDLTAKGAQSARGRGEFHFNRELAHSIAAALARAGARPVLINAEGDRLSLKARVEQINRTNPALLLSVHHDSVQPHFLQTWEVNGQTLDYSDRFSGFSLFVSRRNPQASASEQFARAIGEQLTSKGLRPSLHHAEPIKGENRPLLDSTLGVYAFDGLAVLRGTRAPAVLLEAGCDQASQ